MKSSEIESMLAGEDLDWKIGEIMGLKDIRRAFYFYNRDQLLNYEANDDGDYFPCVVYTHPEYEDMEGLPSYSSLIDAAWRVAEKLADFELRHEEGQYRVGCLTREYGTVWATGETAPLAICRLALLATLPPEGPLVKVGTSSTENKITSPKTK